MISNNDKSNILCIKKIFRKPNSVLNEEISGHGNAFDISSYKIDLQAYTMYMYLFSLNFTEDSPILINIRTEAI